MSALIPSRDQAWVLLNEYTKSASLLKHALAVEASMRAYAQKLGQDEELWGITGLLHDFDYEKYPTAADHPFVGCKILGEQGYPQEMIDAILGHALYSGVRRDTLLAKTLFAVDELTGLTVAVSYMRPEGLAGMEVKSVVKKVKDKSFAAAIDREHIQMGVTELGVTIEDHVATIISGLQTIAELLKK